MRRLIWSWQIVLGLTVTVLQTVAVTLPFAEEGTSVILECMPLGAYTKRVWYRGFLNESTYPPPETLIPLFVQMGDTGEVITYGNRTDMSVENKTFALTIGRLQIHDDGYFTCAAEIGNKTLFNGSYTQVYIQPNVTLDGLDERTLKENDTVTLSCQIDRLYPAILPTDIALFWGEEKVSNVKHTEINNVDGSYGYNVWTIRTLTIDDDGVEVTCSVIPQRGNAVHETRILDVMHAPFGSPKLWASVDEPEISETIDFLCHIDGILANPPVSYILWYINGTPFQNTSTPDIKINISRKDTGKYSCYAGNTFGLSTPSNVVSVRIKEVIPSKDDGVQMLVLGLMIGISAMVVIIIIAFCIGSKREKRRKRSQRRVMETPDCEDGNINPWETATGCENIAGIQDQAWDAGTYVDIIEPPAGGPLPPTPTDEGSTASGSEPPGQDTLPQQFPSSPRILTFETWLERNKISETIAHALHKEHIKNVHDLKLLTEANIASLGLPIGERNRLKEALKTV